MARVTCPKCNLVYDDLNRWTLCPHNRLEVPHDALLCRRCDLYVGYTNNLTYSQDPDHCIACGRSAEAIRRDG